MENRIDEQNPICRSTLSKLISLSFSGPKTLKTLLVLDSVLTGMLRKIYCHKILYDKRGVLQYIYPQSIDLISHWQIQPSFSSATLNSVHCTIVVLQNHLKMPTLSLMPLQYIFEFKSVCDARKTHILIAFHYECGNAATRREKYIKLYESVCVCVVHFGGVEQPKFRRFMAPKWFMEQSIVLGLGRT